MYTSFFGLSEKPFAITPDPRYLYLSERHAEALAHLLLSEWLGRDPDAAVRLLGVGAADLQQPRQSDLFLAPQPKESRLDAAVDDIRDRFGSTALTRASSLARPRGD